MGRWDLVLAIIALVIALGLGAAAFAGKLSVTAASVLVLVASLVLMVAAGMVPALHSLPVLPRLLSWVCAWSGIALCGYYYNEWLATKADLGDPPVSAVPAAPSAKPQLVPPLHDTADLMERLKSLGPLQVFQVLTVADYDTVIAFCDGFIEKEGRVLPTPPLMAIRVEDIRTGVEEIVSGQTPRDVQANMRAHRNAGRAPVRVSIFPDPDSVVELRGRGQIIFTVPPVGGTQSK